MAGTVDQYTNMLESRAAVLNGDRQLLLLQRQDDGLWEFAGGLGHVPTDYTDQVAGRNWEDLAVERPFRSRLGAIAARNTSEQTGIEIAPKKPKIAVARYTLSHVIDSGVCAVYCMPAGIVAGADKAAPGNDHKDLAWVPFKEAMSEYDLTDFTRIAARKLAVFLR